MDKTEGVCNNLTGHALTEVSMSFELSVAEQVRAWRSFVATLPAVGSLFCFLVFGPVAVLVWVNFQDPQQENWWLPAGLLLLGALVAYGLPWGVVLNLRKGQQESQGPQTMMFNSYGIHLRFAKSSFDFAWEAVYRAYESKEFVFIRIGKNAGYFLPKRVLTPETLSSVRELLRSQLGGRARMKS